MLKTMPVAITLAAPLPLLAKETTGRDGHMTGDMGVP